MMPITEEVHAFLTANAAAQIQREDEYLDPADGLLHCKTCHGLRQTVQQPLSAFPALCTVGVRNKKSVNI